MFLKKSTLASAMSYKPKLKIEEKLRQILDDYKYVEHVSDLRYLYSRLVSHLNETNSLNGEVVCVPDFYGLRVSRSSDGALSSLEGYFVFEGHSKDWGKPLLTLEHDFQTFASGVDGAVQAYRSLKKDVLVVPAIDDPSLGIASVNYKLYLIK